MTRAPDARHRSGRRGEDLARRWLEARGWPIVAANWRGGGAELDLVARDGAVLVFVEVRRRGPRARVDAVASVDARKCARLARGARAFIAVHGVPAGGARFDVIAFERDGSVVHLTHAFRLDDLR